MSDRHPFQDLPATITPHKVRSNVLVRVTLRALVHHGSTELSGGEPLRLPMHETDGGFAMIASSYRSFLFQRNQNAHVQLQLSQCA